MVWVCNESAGWLLASLGLGGLAALASCTLDRTPIGPFTDAATIDAGSTLLDAFVPNDAPTSDGRPPDDAAHDASMRDANMQDGNVRDATESDTGRADAAPIDASDLDASIADAGGDTNTADAGFCRRRSPIVAWDFEAPTPLNASEHHPDLGGLSDATLVWATNGGVVGGGAVTFSGGLLEIPVSAGPAIRAEARDQNAFSAEVWVQQSSTMPAGPARIMTCSMNTSIRAFTIGQQNDEVRGRIRSNLTDANGFDWIDTLRTPEAVLIARNVFPTMAPTHIVLVWRRGTARLYINGELIDERVHSAEARLVWADGLSCGFGDEFGNGLGMRRWSGGRLELAAFYVGALSRSDVQCLHTLGPNR